MACLMIVSGAIWDYILFNKAINAQSLYQLVIEDKPNLIKMLQNPSDTDWINKNYDLLEKKLKNLELNNSGTIYKISASSFPQVNIALLNSQH